MATSVGKVVQVIGSTFDVEFDKEGLPEIYNALETQTGEIKRRAACESGLNSSLWWTATA